MRLSVVLPNFNDGEYLGRAISAITGQSLPADEIIIVDDGSTDISRDVILEAVKLHPSIKTIFFDSNKGTNAAVEAGTALATGEFIYFAAADDFVREGFFEQSIQLLQAHPDVHFCSAMTSMHDQSGADLGSIPSPLPDKASGYISSQEAEQYLIDHGIWFRCNTAIYRRQSILDSGGFDRSLGPFSDGFKCMVFALMDGCCYIPEKMGSILISDRNQSTLVEHDTSKSLHILRVANEKFSTLYSDSVSSKVRRVWEGRWRYTLARRVISEPNEDWALDILEIINQPSSLEYSLIKVLDKTFKKPPFFLKPFLLLRLSPKDLGLALKSKLALFRL